MHEEDHFGEEIAATYDDDAEMFAADAVEETAAFLTALAKGGPALEFGVGTGRIALPLSARGVRVHGIDLSESMLARLRAKSGSDEVGVTVGDFATSAVSGRFSLVYLIFNTINNLTTQAAQVACFRNAAAHLVPGGHFVVEVGVPALQRLPPGETLVPFRLDAKHWGVDEYDVVTQAFTSHHLRIEDGKAERHSVPFRYVWPAELDLMAQLAGMILKERWGNWRREPFTATSTSHVSVWGKPEN